MHFISLVEEQAVKLQTNQPVPSSLQTNADAGHHLLAPDQLRLRMDGLQLSVEARSLFEEGISLVLSRWSSLQLAVENEWGGRRSRDKAIKLGSDIFIWFTQTKGELYIDDLENLLDEAMLSLNTEVADGSIEEVAYDLVCMHDECLGGNYESIQRLRAANSQARPVQHIREAENDDDSDGVDDEAMVDVPETKTNTNQTATQAANNEPNPPHAAAADDGWEVVSSKKNRGRKN